MGLIYACLFYGDLMGFNWLWLCKMDCDSAIATMTWDSVSFTVIFLKSLFTPRVFNLVPSMSGYKVVPPSYKLVYNPINFRYITYKP